MVVAETLDQETFVKILVERLKNKYTKFEVEKLLALLPKEEEALFKMINKKKDEN